MAAKDLGNKHACFKCGTKFYDLKRPAPLCPKCGADQREVPPAARLPPRKPAARPDAAEPDEPVLDAAGEEETPEEEGEEEEAEED